jgi:hypothetical protein
MLHPSKCRDLARATIYACGMALRIHRVSASQWAQLAATRRDTSPTDGRVIDLTGRSAFDRSRPYRVELALIQAYIDALRPQPAPASR